MVKMRLLRELENKLESLVDNIFAGKFKSSVEPIEIARQLRKTMLDNKRISIKNNYVPSSYTVELSESDFKDISSLGHKLIQEIAFYLEEEAKNEGVVPVSRVQVKLKLNHKLKQGIFNIDIEDELKPEEERKPIAYIEIEGRNKRIPVTQNKISIGRLKSCDICLPFSGVSRSHAKIWTTGGKFYIEDEGSSNGTYIGEKRIARTQIDFNQKILIADIPIFLRRGLA